jgi:G3E family GTPase
MKPIPFFIVTGFLGSGKTTLMKRFLYTWADRLRIAVIQNEFTPINVDGRELKTTGKPFRMVEINRGSVFCVCLLSDFQKILIDLVDSYRPDMVLLEATGLADPIAVGELLTALDLRKRVYLARIWSVVDGVRFLELCPRITQMERQIRIADTVLINKIDLAPQNEDAIRLHIQSLNPFADIRTVSYCEIPLDDILKGSVKDPVAIRQKKKHTDMVPSGRLDMGTAVIKTTRRISEDHLQYFLHDMVTKTYRLKGVVQLSDGSSVAVQSCFGETQVQPIPAFTGPTVLVGLGPDIQVDTFREKFQKMSG